jgi:hypothetical protein
VTHHETCAEPIAGETRVREGRQEPRTQQCGLPASDWCATCRYYVCVDHINSRHDRHTRTTAPVDRVAPYDPKVQGDRRSGERREP